MAGLVAGDLIQAARDFHPREFSRDKHPHRACLAFLSDRQRQHLKELADVLKDRLSQARSVAAVVTGSLVGVDASGTPYAASASTDGFAAAVDSVGTLYLVGPVISADPYVSGFPLPDDSLEIVDIYATLSDGTTLVPVDWLSQRVHSRAGTAGPRSLSAIVNGWRLIPQKNPTTEDGLWTDVTSVTVVWIAEPQPLHALADTLTIPTVYGRQLQYELAAFLARRESATNQSFSPDLAQFYTQQAESGKAQNVASARMDHRTLKSKTILRTR
jgi:hypothetical protein